MRPTDRSSRPFRVGVLSVVKHDYIPHAIAAHPRFELVVVADDADRPDWTHERNQLLADTYRIPYIKDVSKAIAEFELDAVAISSEAERHCDLGRRAAAAGLHIVIDKPLSTKLEDCDAFVDAVEDHAVQCLIWNRSLLPTLNHAAEVVDAGALGRLDALHCDFYFAKDAGPAIGGREAGAPPINWLERQLEAHADGSDGAIGVEPMGELEVEGIYPLAYIRRLTDHAEARSVYAHTASHFHQAHADNGVDDLATVTLDLETGQIATLCLGRIGADAHPDLGDIKLRLIGEHGAAVFAEPRPEVEFHYRDQAPQEFRRQRIADDGNYRLMENFARAIEGQERPVLNAFDGRNICATILAALKSAKTGKPVQPDIRKQ